MIFYKERANGWKKVFSDPGCHRPFDHDHRLSAAAYDCHRSGADLCCLFRHQKSVFLSPIQSLLYETIFLAPVALGFIFYFELNGNGAIAVGDAGKFCLLLLAGLATAIPLGLFSFAANKLPLITLGLTEYISPSISLLLGIFLFREPFDGVQFCAFVVIWIGLAFLPMGK